MKEKHLTGWIFTQRSQHPPDPENPN